MTRARMPGCGLGLRQSAAQCAARHRYGARLILAAAVAGALLLPGCAFTTRRIESQVQSFATQADLVHASYRIERLPSQQNSPWQDVVEANASQALTRAGLRSAGADAAYTLEVSAERERHPQLPTFNQHPVIGLGMMQDENSGVYVPATLQSSYVLRLHLLLRDSSSHQVAFESSAVYDGPWADFETLLPAVLAAALHDYPQATPAPHRVVVELPPNGLPDTDPP